MTQRARHRWNQRTPPPRLRWMQLHRPRSVAVTTALVAALGLAMTGCGSRTNNVATPVVTAVGANFASLSPLEICGLFDEPAVNRTFDYSFDSVDGMAPEYSIDQFGASCGFDATSDGFQGDRLSVKWFVGAPTVADGHFRQWPYGVQEGQKRTSATIDGHAATVFINNETTSVQTMLANRVLSVETFTDNDSRKARLTQQSMAFMKMLITSTSSLQPGPLPADDGPVPQLFEMTPGQVCSLLRDSTVATLASNSMSRAQPGPDAYDTMAVEPHMVSCTKGRSKVAVAITDYASGQFPDTRIGGLPARWSTMLVDEADPRSQRLPVEVMSTRTADDTAEERLVSLTVDSTNDTPEIRALLQGGMEHLLDELNQRLPTPLVNAPA